MNQEAFIGNLTNTTTWLRGLYMLVFVFINYIARLLILAVAIFQFLSVLFTGNQNNKLKNFGQSLSTYVYDIAKFLTFVRESKPYPFSDWGEDSEEPTAEQPSSTQSEDSNDSHLGV